MPVKKSTKNTAKKGLKSLYILDTNVLLHDPKALYQFDDVRIGIPVIVLEEVDKFKHEGTDRGRNARETIRILDRLRENGSLRDGVALENGSVVQVLFLPNKSTLGKDIIYLEGGQDNAILLIAAAYQAAGYKVTFISKDLNARVKADALGIATQDYIHNKVSTDEFYHGWVQVAVNAVELKPEFPGVLQELADSLSYNEFVLVESRNNPYNHRIFRYLGGKKFKIVQAPQLQWPLNPRNPQQFMAMDLLLDPTLPFVCLFGPAGTGKTFLALLAGLHQTLIQHEYEKMLISRPVIPLGRDIGYLPGTMEEKLYSWMLPIYDNVQFIVHSAKVESHLEIMDSEYNQNRNQGRDDHRNRKDRHGKKRKHHDQHNKNDRDFRSKGFMSLEDLIKRGKISLEAITYMRGRSIPFQYILIDEAQNLTPHEIKTLVTRVGEGSKIVLAGDPYQIDSPYLDFASNGLVTASERFKGQKLFGTVYLPTTERSPLSDLASDLL